MMAECKIVPAPAQFERGRSAARAVDRRVGNTILLEGLKTPKGLTPYEYICKCWTSKPGRFKRNPLQQMH